MKVVCDNCGALYKIPDEKLLKPVNKATCRQCAHRMLIPRPRRGADPNERTLVTAVPPTPDAPPTRGYGPTTSTVDVELDDEVGEEAEEVPGDQSATLFVRNEDLHSAKKTAPLTQSVSHASPPAPAPAPAPMPQPIPRAPTHPLHIAPPAYDPSGDLSIAFLGAVGALLGLFILATVILLNLPEAVILVGVFVGLVIGICGSLTAMLVVLTGNRGQRPAQRMLSVLLAALLAILIAILPVSVRAALTMVLAPQTSADGVRVADPPDPVRQPPSPREDTSDAMRAIEDALASSEQPTMEEIPPDPEGVADPTLPAPAEAPRPSPAPTLTIQPAPRPQPSPKPGPAPSSAPKPVPEPAPQPTPVPAQPAPTSASIPVAPPLQAVDTMVKSNGSVKRCFYYYQKDHGSLPPRVIVKFRISPDGSASRVGITQANFAGTDLDLCLARAIRSITFPPSQQGADISGFPFIFQ